MTCRSCGHVIAHNAIVCYKCGTPTATAAPRPGPSRTHASRRPLSLAVVIAIGSGIAAGIERGGSPWIWVPLAGISLAAVILLAAALVRRS